MCFRYAVVVAPVVVLKVSNTPLYGAWTVTDIFSTLSNVQSDPSLSIFIMTICRTDLCRLEPQDSVSIYSSFSLSRNKKINKKLYSA